MHFFEGGWTVVNERDELGDELVPDYMTAVKDGGFYGWPYSYFGQHVDVRVKPPRADLVALAIEPDYVLGSHTASMGLAALPRNMLAGPLRPGHVHGLWRCAQHSGYKIVFVSFAHGKPTGVPLHRQCDLARSRQGGECGLAHQRGPLILARPIPRDRRTGCSCALSGLALHG